MPKVTVLMAVYDGEKYLRVSIESILNQTYEDFELLVIDDGSTDNTLSIIHSYSDPRIRVVSNQGNLGLAKSLNIGLELAKGEFIARQDADDISEPHRLEKEINHLEKNPDIVLIGSNCRRIDEYGNLINYSNYPTDTDSIRWEIIFQCPFIHSSVIFRKDIVLSQVGMYNGSISYAEDWEFWSRIAFAFPVESLNEQLIRFRKHSDSMTSSYGEITKRNKTNIRKNNIKKIIRDNSFNFVDSYKVNTDHMYLVLYKNAAKLTNEQLDNAVNNILLLFDSFSEKYKLSESKRKKLLIKIYKKIVFSYFRRMRILKTMDFSYKLYNLDKFTILNLNVFRTFMRTIFPRS